MSKSSTVKLVARWQRGDQQAATELVQRYTGRLIALAQGRLSARLASRIDAEDVVQSAYRSFFAGARAGRFDIRQGSDLWQLLVVITLNKLHNQVRHNLVDKRSVRREQRLAGERNLDRILAQHLAQEPSPIEALALVDEVERLMQRLDPEQRRMLELRLQGHDLEEIAEQTQRSQRTVRRLLKWIKDELAEARREQSAV
jgi:RNA polymerase sigma-70 factor (ECF subfamily)